MDGYYCCWGSNFRSGFYPQWKCVAVSQVWLYDVSTATCEDPESWVIHLADGRICIGAQIQVVLAVFASPRRLLDTHKSGRVHNSVCTVATFFR